MSDYIKIAAIQTNPKILQKEDNLRRCLEHIQVAAGEGAKLLIFPECSLTGYCYKSLDEGLSVAESIPGPSTKEISSLCGEFKVHSIVGLLEKSGKKLFNSLAFIGPRRIIGSYRKIHLPFLGIDRFVDRGDLPLSVYETEIGRIGLNICFDVRFQETARTMALLGTERIVLATNSPVGAESNPDFVVNTRAYENRVNYIAVDRVGRERGVNFIGRSKIIDYSGKTISEASSDKEEIIYADIDMESTRNKHVVMIPGEYELSLFKERRPEFYGVITNKIGKRI